MLHTDYIDDCENLTVQSHTQVVLHGNDWKAKIQKGDPVSFLLPASSKRSRGVFLDAQRKSNGCWARVLISTECPHGNEIDKVVRVRLSTLRRLV